MILLDVQEQYDWQHSKFYFRTMTECEIFMNVFRNHFCNVPWNTPKIIPDTSELSEYDLKYLNRDPKIRAESNLSWGFSLVKFNNIDLNEQQMNFINDFMICNK